MQNIVRIYLLLPVLLLLTITSCYYDGNKVSLSADDSQFGECVNAHYPAYESIPYEIAAQGKVGPLYSDGFPQNILMPSKSPLCISMTITNTNHGHNSNNIVVVGKGLEALYELDGQQVSQPVYDPKAADINIDGGSQNAGIISVFDPENCVTTQGKHVRLLQDNFHSCKFYIQITDTKYHIVKDNKIQLRVTYSNGDQIYQANREVKYSSKIFLGSDGSPLSAMLNLKDKFATWNHNKTDEAVSFVVSDHLGDIYAFTKDNLYIYQGNNLLYSDKLYSDKIIQPSNIFSDQSGNVYVITNEQELYILNVALYQQGQTLASMKSILPPEIKKIQDITQYKNNVYIIGNGNKVYKGEDHNWILFFDGDNYSDLKDKQINTLYFPDDKNILFAIDNLLYRYSFSDNKIVNIFFNGDPSYQDIIKILNLNDETYVAYNSNLPEHMPSLLYKKATLSDYFEPIAQIKATALNGVLDLSGQKTLCLYGKDLYSTSKDILSMMLSTLHNSDTANFLCVTEDKIVTPISGVNGVAHSAVGVGSFDQ